MKTKKADFKLFKKECEKWIEFFGLKQYSINYKHEEKEGGLALSRIDSSSGMWATLTLNKDWGRFEINNKEIKTCAFHEVCHVLLERLFYCGTCRYTTYEEMTHNLESTIKTLENSVFKQFDKRD